ncbi:MAG: abortive infection family protein [Longimicrobiales bacterium]
MNQLEELLEVVESVQNMCLARATGSYPEEPGYQAARQRLMAEPLVSSKLPRFVRTCRGLGEFWPYISGVDGTYAGRRAHIWEEFRPVLDFLETQARSPGDTAVSESLDHLGEGDIATFWQRALERRSTDPEGAITSARTLLESTCKIILEDLGIEYPAHPDLPKLYHLVAKELNLAPQQHDEDIFKRILGGATMVVEGLGTVRNRYGDSHGKGKAPVKPSDRHAELAVNLAGAVAAFLAATWRAKKSGIP